MGDLTTFETIIIAIVEGLTEFLPVSSTGHMIITQNILGVESTEFVKSIYCNYSVWRNSFSCLPLLETFFPVESYTGSCGCFRFEVFSA